MSTAVEEPLLLSTPDSNNLEQRSAAPTWLRQQLSSEQISITYEVDRTIAEIRAGQWKTIALQFPDDMLSDAPAVFEALCTGLRPSHSGQTDDLDIRTEDALMNATEKNNSGIVTPKPKFYILADTSYGSCCVDETAAEHINADVVVHYGRACLSSTTRLPVIYVYTIQPLQTDLLFQTFRETFRDRNEKIILMADLPYSSHIPQIGESLKFMGYTNLHVAGILHDPSSPLPNRTVPDGVGKDLTRLKLWQLFHISSPPQSLLLVLCSRVSKIYIFPNSPTSSNLQSKLLETSTALALQKRYAILTSMNTASVIGILINTLSVRNYLYVVESLKNRISAAGKKSYIFVIGKVNAAKVANFSEIDGWVVVGCWESSLIDSKDFWKPILTPFELDLALQKDEERVWTGKWISDFQSVLKELHSMDLEKSDRSLVKESFDQDDSSCLDGIDTEPESEPPEFDLRSGRYVSDARPRQSSSDLSKLSSSNVVMADADKALIKRLNGDLAVVGGELSPGAEYLRSKRTWGGLGSDFEIAYDEPETSRGAAMEEGRSGIARGYSVNGGNSRT